MKTKDVILTQEQLIELEDMLAETPRSQYIALKHMLTLYRAGLNTQLVVMPPAVERRYGQSAMSVSVSNSMVTVATPWGYLKGRMSRQENVCSDVRAERAAIARALRPQYRSSNPRTYTVPFPRLHTLPPLTDERREELRRQMEKRKGKYNR